MTEVVNETSSEFLKRKTIIVSKTLEMLDLIVALLKLHTDYDTMGH